ncbi:MAG: NADH-quinone oxidoreductase subunit NuoK [Methanobacteriota archaeon]|mgnify:FL=1|jgi:NADH:ubiquinone oxidoreductase subunit K|uniref:NADH-quinone oxidoreductase subunit K n=1 Tax=Marine Group III euryarchaeote CG-Epi2 TaxID=1888996 RepID=A0A1J5TNE5_9ARCH|nr:NADH-quinone oxidoreductase subunit NuoK [Euryarchaeota archaeon]MDE0741359.1 NADH-quinone oxidoreductase subunit NuoK [Candidatus Poseidoniia archaeon]MDG1544600.1 NADH-quinone oxidoreductase subunit NuoK [archaeon]OIR22447.1 MAG: NADH-quinone oxidoreductase subunit K [Marine Group III euryarchaeote CG-Epi2]RZD38685.1 MAG: NADH-quinone oxidoreductase subunit NuoK [Euryarchaeota archaeon]|tara:strand:+ start:107 stop:409 length:303 start_codon:yes stop_codon:yes gene_type:complete
MIDPINFVVFSSILLLIGAYGVIRNKNAIVVLMSVEIMLTAANINFVAFSTFYNVLSGQIVVLFVTTIAAAEVAIGLAILLSLFKQRDTIELDLLNRLRW